jgi:hypothetical protein
VTRLFQHATSSDIKPAVRERRRSVTRHRIAVGLPDALPRSRTPNTNAGEAARFTKPRPVTAPRTKLLVRNGLRPGHVSAK